MNILVSACLLGIKCRYDGGGKRIEKLEEILKNENIIPVCPEQLGGLSIPRPPAEISRGRVISKTGGDVTEEFRRGADEVLKIAREKNCKIAVLKENSPSCGCGKVYDGTFSGILIDGNGITAKLLLDNGITVIGESGLEDLLELMGNNNG